MSKEIIIDGVKYAPVEEQEKATVKKINITIKNRFTGSIIFESEKTTYREAIKEAIDTGADLTDADLTDADLTDANLTGADLTRANLTRANLTRADLTGADLTDANLTRANLTACLFYLGSSNKNFEALCKAIKTIKWNSNTGTDFLK